MSTNCGNDGTFLTKLTVLCCFYQGIINYCVNYDINANTVATTLQIKPHSFQASDRDCESLYPHFCFLRTNWICQTTAYTLQKYPYFAAYQSRKIFLYSKSASGISYCNEDDCLNQIFSDISAIDGGEICTFIGVGRISHYLLTHKSQGSNEKDLLKAI